MGLLAVARAVTALGRESFIPPIFSLVSVKLGTPIFTTAILGIVTGTILGLRLGFGIGLGVKSGLGLRFG